MDYKTQLQNHNTALTGHNTNLQNVLEKINNLPTATESVNLDTEITEQENIITSQDDIIDQIKTALEDKAVGGVAAKTTKTIYLDWSGDEEYTGIVRYLTNEGTVEVDRYSGINEIETIGGIVSFNYNFLYDPNLFIEINDLTSYSYIGLFMAKQDGATIYIVSSGEQGV